jgi:heme-degrading monooxygenase HmoA
MFVVINDLFVSPENRGTFERNFSASMRDTLPDVPGLSSTRLLRPEEADRGYLSVLDFVDDAAYTAYLSSDAFRAAHTWPDHAPIDGSRLTTYHVCSEIRGVSVVDRAGWHRCVAPPHYASCCYLTAAPANR